MTYYLKKEWKLNTLAVLFLIGVSGCEAMTNLVMMRTTQSIIDFDLTGFAKWMLIDLGLFALMIGLDQIGTICKGRAVRKMNNRIRMDMAASLAEADYRQFHDKESGEYLSQLTNNLNQIENLAWNAFYQCVTTAALVVFSIIALLTLHWSLVVLAVLSALVLLNAPKLFGRKMEELGEACAQKQAAGTSRMKDLLSGLDVLRSFGRSDRFLSGMKEASDQVEQPKYHLDWMKNLAQNSITMVSILVQVVINCAIGFLSIKGIILQAALMGGGNLCGAISNGLAGLGNFKLSFTAAKPYFEAITIHEEDLPDRKETASEPLRDGITLENLHFGYGEKAVLENASFRFAKGGKYALTGPSGCGKSTVLKLILGYLPDYQGAVRFDSRNARDFSPEQIQQRISYIDQNVFLFNTTIRDNITLGGDFSETALSRAIEDSALTTDLTQMPLGLDTPVGENGSSLSGGQKQRVAIARALIHSRSILLVDEGTSALDQKNADIVEQSLLQNPDLTLILVSHHLTPERRKQFTKVFDLESAGAAN